MVTVTDIASIVIKVVKLIINFIVLILYRVGYNGQFLGVGGAWNLNEIKSADAEIVASGVLVGFFIYTAVVLITFCFGTTAHKRTLVDILMNMVGTFMFIAVGGTALHYWTGYINPHDYRNEATERVAGIAVGSLCVIEGALYLLDTVLAFLHFARESVD